MFEDRHNWMRGSPQQEPQSPGVDVDDEYEGHAKLQRAMFANAENMKEKIRDQMSKPTYDVANFYHKRGCAQKIARSNVFDQTTLFIIVLNAIWIFIDTDYNPADVLAHAPIIFQVVEQLFCFYFVFEWTVRFLAFKKKCNGCRDAWFVFDTALVILFVMDTWIVYTYVKLSGTASSGGLGNASILRVARLLRLTRMARMARLLRVMPELIILIKGMGAAMRSVGFTLILLVLLLYVFGIAFKQLCADPDLHICQEFFSSVPRSMHSLLVHGTLMDDLRDFVIPLEEYSIWFLMLFYFFLLLSALTVMNMLIGVLCDVVNNTASVEKEALAVLYVKDRLSVALKHMNLKASDCRISKEEFLEILNTKEAAMVLREVGVDVIGLVDFADFIFKDDIHSDDLAEEEVKTLSFSDFVQVILKLRGNNNATVRDIVDLRKFVQLKTASLDTKMDAMNVRSKVSSRQTVIGRNTMRASGSTSSDIGAGTPSMVPPSPMSMGSTPSGSPLAQQVDSEGNFRPFRSTGSSDALDSVEKDNQQLPGLANRRRPSFIQTDVAAAGELSPPKARMPSRVSFVEGSLASLEADAPVPGSEFRRLLRLLALEYDNTVATLQRGNERLQAEVNFLKATSAANYRSESSEAHVGFGWQSEGIERITLQDPSAYRVPQVATVGSSHMHNDNNILAHEAVQGVPPARDCRTIGRSALAEASQHPGEENPRIDAVDHDTARFSSQAVQQAQTQAQPATPPMPNAACSASTMTGNPLSESQTLLQQRKRGLPL